MTRSCVALLLLVACGSDDPVDVCSVPEQGVAGAADIGRGGDAYVPIMDGETFSVQLGLQGLWMFVVSARITGLEVADGETAAVWYEASASDGTLISLPSGCRAREFETSDAQTLEMSEDYFLAILPDYTYVLDGGEVTLQLVARDQQGQQATVERTIVSAMPN